MPVENGETAPAFSLSDAQSGEQRSLADALKRGPVVLGIYKSSCQASKTAFPFLEKIAHGYPADRLTVWGIAQDSANVTRSFARRTGVSFPILIDEDDYAVSRAYDILATPTIYLIDSAGTILWQGMGYQKPAIEELNAAVADLLGEPEVDITEGTDGVPPWVPG
jgi:peroxiredoxin